MHTSKLSDFGNLPTLAEHWSYKHRPKAKSSALIFLDCLLSVRSVQYIAYPIDSNVQLQPQFWSIPHCFNLYDTV